MDVTRIRQGDACPIGVEIEYEDGSALAIEDVAAVEFMVGPTIRKVYPAQVAYEQGAFQVPLTQKETLALNPDQRLTIDARVKLTTGEILGCSAETYVEVQESLSGREI